MNRSAMKFSAVIAFLIAVTAAQAGASSITLSLSGIFNGVSVDATSFGINGVFSTAGGNAVAKKVKMTDITITKPLDTSTSKLFLDAADGTHIGSGAIDYFKTGSSVPYEQLTFSDLIITSVSINGLQNLEEFTLAFQNVTFEFQGDSTKPPLGAFLPLSTDIQLGPFSINYLLFADRLDFQLGNSDVTSASTSSGSVPEPATLTLLGCGLAGILLRRRAR